VRQEFEQGCTGEQPQACGSSAPNNEQDGQLNEFISDVREESSGGWLASAHCAEHMGEVKQLSSRNELVTRPEEEDDDSNIEPSTTLGSRARLCSVRTKRKLFDSAAKIL
jgi:hypothetical protein